MCLALLSVTMCANLVGKNSLRYVKSWTDVPAQQIERIKKKPLEKTFSPYAIHTSSKNHLQDFQHVFVPIAHHKLYLTESFCIVRQHDTDYFPLHSMMLQRVLFWATHVNSTRHCLLGWWLWVTFARFRLYVKAISLKVFKITPPIFANMHSHLKL